MENKGIYKVGIAILILTLILILWLSGIIDKSNLVYIKSLEAAYAGWYREYRFLATIVFTSAYILLVSLSLPGSSVLTLAAGAVFGFWHGVALVSFSGAVGATIAAYNARFLVRDLAERRFGPRLAAVNRGLEKEGLLYLLLLRLIPVIPFVVLNPLIGLTRMPLLTFYWVSQIGMLPGNMIYIDTGSQMACMSAWNDLFSAKLWLPRILLVLLSLTIKKIRTHFI